VQLIGRVGCDPDIRFPSEGSDRVWARFTVATDSRYHNDDRPDWHTVIVRDRLAQFVLDTSPEADWSTSPAG